MKSHEPIDRDDLYVRVRIHDVWQKTSHKINDRDKIVWNEGFFYNTTEILDDDVSFELYAVPSGYSASKRITESKIQKGDSRL